MGQETIGLNYSMELEVGRKTLCQGELSTGLGG